MLLSLHINNFALIDDLKIDFDKGLNIITGETGSGKSIIIDALNLTLGLRADKDMIRTGCDKAEIETVFTADSENAVAYLNKMGLYENDGCIIIYREINLQGRNILRINGHTVNTYVLKELTSYLIDIYGQSEHQSLYDPQNHIKLLDEIGGLNIKKIKENLNVEYTEYEDLLKERDNLKKEGNDELQLEFIKYQLNEIETAKLNVNEEEELKNLKSRLNNSEKIHDAVASSYKLINGGSEGTGISDNLSVIINKLSSVASYDKIIENIVNHINDCYYQIEDINAECRSLLENIKFDPDKLNQIEERLNFIYTLKRKYARDIPEILKYRDSLKDKIKRIENNKELTIQLNEKINKKYEKVKNICDKLSSLRLDTAEKLKSAIKKQLTELGIKSAQFGVEFGTKEITKEGYDKVEFKLSANPGEPLKPLWKVASGGEASRIMLGFKKVFSDVDHIDTLVFDEIDTGISGQAVNSVARKFLELSFNKQIICITHLPQIASLADKHFKIDKFIKNGRTYTHVKELDKKDQIMEISRILSGNNITDITVSHSKEMLKIAEELKLSSRQKT